MDAFLVSTGLVALAEIGDKTQLLALLLAARYRQPTAIIFGILCATLLNHAGAAALGTWITAYLGYDRLRWILGASFLIMAAWVLIPDKQDEAGTGAPRLGVFGATFVAFFLAEMGDKTQVATVALAAQYTAFYAVVAGTTLGMMIANVPAVLFGERLTRKIPARLIHGVAALVFAGLGLAVLLNAAATT
jgi:putative Ca2+/H+ antiporter (TMEM165/GDT1 family)